MLNLTFGQSVGLKFNADGSVKHFPGNTIVCVLDHDTEVYRRIKHEKDFIESTIVNNCISILPDESLHMTAIEGVCDHVRKETNWTSRFPLDTPLVEIDDFLEEQWKTIPTLTGVRMRFDNLWVESGICVGLYPATYEDDVKIRDWRDLVSERTGLRFPGHDRYRFHISMAYGIKMPTEEERICLEKIKEDFDKECKEKIFEFEIPSPSLTFFDDMFFFNKHRIPREN